MKSVVLMCCVLWMCGFSAARAEGSLLNQEPDVVYFEGEKKIEFVVAQAATIFANKNAGRRLGAFAEGTKVQLLAMTDKGYKVKGMASHGVVTGWVSPKKLASKDPQFIENLKAYYERALIVRELISTKRVASGMTMEEVRQALGKPSKEEVRATKDGRSGKWEYIKSEEQKHYVTMVDPRSGQAFRRYSHSTVEVKEQLTVEFENGVVSAVVSLKDDTAGNVKIVVPPVVFGY